MKILLVGGGGREHALAWKLTRSDRVDQIIVAPGNGGTALPQPKISNRQAPDGFLALARSENVDLTVVGPEVPLADGIVDEFEASGLKIWGPSRAAAQIEASKAFAKEFMRRHTIPTAAHATFTDYDAALSYIRSLDTPFVIKASGLAAGKGVILPESVAEAEAALRQIMVDKVFGAAGNELLVEERLTGPEASVLAFCDGHTARLMPPAQDHKRVFDHDAGPNTGGMGAYAPAPVCPPALQQQILETIIQPTLDGLRADGMPYLGVLYAGLMLTVDGPQVIEFNCRFGDPETQVLLPLLDTDLIEIIEHCLKGTLEKAEIQWKSGSAATVVMASGGYPGRYEIGKPVSGLAEANALDGVIVFHAGTALTDDDQIVTAGGRVLNVTGVGDSLADALATAYAGVRLVDFEAAHHRTDIGAKATIQP